MTTVVCVLRSGGEFTREHVVALHRGVVQHWGECTLPRFVALTDQVLNIPGVEERVLPDAHPGWWAKMALLDPAHADLGDMLYFDLDTMIVGNLVTIANTTHLTLLQDFYYPEKVQSGMMLLPAWAREEAFAVWSADPFAIMESTRGDGEFLHSLWRRRCLRWQLIVPEQVVSYKVHVRQSPGQVLPARARVVCFHGRPRPWDTPLWKRLGC